MVIKKITKWNDGDSGFFTDGTPFRLARVRTPEKHQFGGERATRTVAGMTGQSRGVVDVKSIARDSYGRLLVEMRNRDGSVNSRMRSKGYINKGR